MENDKLESFKSYFKWSKEEPQQEKGIVVATNSTQEWLLIWWWENYRKHNDLPVSFVDFGMSKEMKAWCKEKGHYIPLSIPDVFIAERNSFSKIHIEKWEQEFGSYFWDSRPAWFKKPLACLQSPYKTSLWMDLDCEVRGPLDPLLSHPLYSEISISKKYLDGLEPINSGVIVFKHGSSLIRQWAELCFEQNHTAVGDQDVLWNLIAINKFQTDDLSLLYNWSRFSKENPEALVVHWHGNHGKTMISHQIAKKNLEISGLI